MSEVSKEDLAAFMVADWVKLAEVSDALAAAVEAHSFAFSDDTALTILAALAEYRKIRPVSAPEPILGDSGQ